jgi:hypothetical protein
MSIMQTLHPTANLEPVPLMYTRLQEQRTAAGTAQANYRLSGQEQFTVG